ncbi:hypothetical protein, partial [Halomarina rubra]
MARAWIGPLLAAVVAVAALSMAAATFDSARPDEGLTLGGGDGADTGRNVGGGDGASSAGDAPVVPALLPDVAFGSDEATLDDGGGSLPVVVLLAVVGLLALAAGVLYRLTGDDDRASLDDTTTPDATATDASDWPVDPSLSNEVYRAWYDLARRTPVANRATATPGDVAVAAVANGQPSGGVR